MTHPLVTQLRFARSELQRCLEGVSAADAQRRLLPTNSIGWIVGHLANQEQTYWIVKAQHRTPIRELSELVGTGRPASTPPLAGMWEAWAEITSSADAYLDTLTTEVLERHLEWQGKLERYNVGTMLLRNIYHYWYHTGEASAIRQLMQHPHVPDFVGDMSRATYRPEP